jgi:hypothetical protein
MNIRIITVSFGMAVACSASGASAEVEATEKIERIRVNCTLIVEDLRSLDSALSQLALEKKLPFGTVVSAKALIPYVNGATLGKNLASPGGPFDRFGRPYGPLIIGKVPSIDQKTIDRTKDALGADYKRFWTQYFPNR